MKTSLLQIHQADKPGEISQQDTQSMTKMENYVYEPSGGIKRFKRSQC